VAKKGDGWLSRERGGLAGRLVAKQGDGWLSQGDGRLRRGMAQIGG
jgi:hypothetical protein